MRSRPAGRGPGKTPAFIGGLFLAAVILVCLPSLSAQAGSGTSSGEETSPWQEALDACDFSEIQDLLDQNSASGTISFGELVSRLVEGDIRGVGSGLAEYLSDALIREVDGNRSGLWQVLLLATVGALFANLSSVFGKEGISEMGFFVTYLLLASLLLSSFFLAAEIVQDTVTLLLDFMSALLPAFFLAAAFSGAGVTSMAFYELALVVIAVSEWLFARIFLPLIQVYVVVGILNQLSRETPFTRAGELLASLLQWGLRMLLGVVTGCSLIQGILLPSVDAVQTGTASKVISALPGIGNGAASLLSLVLGAGNLIRNGIGTAALVTLIFLSAVPLCKLAIIYLMYAAAAALMEPVSDKRMTGCTAGVAGGIRLLMKTLLTALLLFLVLIAVICACTGLAG